MLKIQFFWDVAGVAEQVQSNFSHDSDVLPKVECKVM